MADDKTVDKIVDETAEGLAGGSPAEGEDAAAVTAPPPDEDAAAVAAPPAGVVSVVSRLISWLTSPPGAVTPLNLETVGRTSSTNGASLRDRSSWASRARIVVCAALPILGAAFWQLVVHWDKVEDLLGRFQDQCQQHCIEIMSMDADRLAKLVEAKFSSAPHDVDARYVVLDVSARFLASEFNTRAILRSLSPITVSTADASVRTEATWDESGIAWTVWLELGHLGKEGIKLSAGPLNWHLSADDLNLRQRRGRFRSSEGVSGAVVRITIERPRWVILSSARVLSLAGTAEPLLQVDVSNYTETPVFVNAVRIEAKQVPRMRCSVFPGSQEVRVDWGELLSGTGDAVTTTLDGKSVVDVEAELQTHYVCHTTQGGEFKLLVPVDMKINPNDRQRQTLTIRDVEGTSAVGGDDLRVTDASVTRPLTWNDVRVGVVGVKEGPSVFPSILRPER